MRSTEIVIQASLLNKSYQMQKVEIEVLKNADFEIERGEFSTIGGASGSGKTTLLNIIGGLDKPTNGKIIVFGEDLGAKDEDYLASFRCNNVGFVFQTYNLVSTLTVAENIAFPMEWLRKPLDQIENRVKKLLEDLRLNHRAEHFPFQLSGGEQQRIAFARALANDPPLLLADEPTGNLDKKTRLKIIEILQELKDQGKTIIVATHEEEILGLANQKLYLEDSRLTATDE